MLLQRLTAATAEASQFGAHCCSPAPAVHETSWVRQTHVLLISLAEMHHRGCNRVDAKPIVELTSPDTHRQAFKSMYFQKLMILNPDIGGWACSTLLFPPPLLHEEETVFSQRLTVLLIPRVEGCLGFWRKGIKYCKTCSKIAGVGKSAAVITKGYYSPWSCWIFIYGWHPSARSQQTRHASTQTLARAGPGSAESTSASLAALVPAKLGAWYQGTIYSTHMVSV